MKRLTTISITICMLIGLVTQSNAQQNVIKMNLLSPILRTANFSYERVLGEGSSVQLGFLYSGAKVSGVKFRGYAITPEFRFYLSQSPAPDGFYVAPFLRFQDYDLSEESTEFSGRASKFWWRNCGWKAMAFQGARNT